MIFSLRFNNDLPVSEYVAAAQCAETVGFDQFWVSHDLFLRSAPVILTAVATQTERIQLGTCILNPYSTSPAEIAMSAATIDEVSGGRFLLGVAAGAADFLDWVGVEQRRPLQRMRETVDVLRRLLRGETAELDGEELKFSADAYLRFELAERAQGQGLRDIPIYLGANGPKMLELAGEVADGVLPLLFPPEHYFGVRPLIAKGEERRDANLGVPDVAACVWVSIDPDPAAARQPLAEKIAYYGHSLSPLIFERLGLDRDDFTDVFEIATRAGELERAADLVTPKMMRMGIAGRPEEVINRLLPLVQAGVQHVSFGPPLGPDVVRSIAVLGREVLPELRAVSS